MIVAFLILKLLFLFAYPILFLSNERKALNVIKHSISYSRKNKKNVLLTALFVIIVGLVLSLLSLSLSFVTINQIVIFVLLYVVNLFLQLTTNLWTNVFIFKRY
jgi:hypothetical protein